MSTNAVLYLRQSTSKQAESLATQLEHNKRLCEQNGWAIAHCYQDEAVSGKSTKNRPELAKALEHVCRDKYVLVAYSLSRIARSTRDAIEIFDRINKAGAELALAKEKLDTTGPFGRFMFRLLANLAELERDLVSERTKDAMQRLRKTGKRMSGHAPYGKIVKDGKLEDMPNEQEGLSVLRSLAIDGYSSQGASDYLNLHGFRYRGGGKWTPEAVRRAFRANGIVSGSR